MLGQRYLWVDRLCICQDDREVQTKQIDAMGDIYNNAVFTIIAANGWDANHGLRGIEGLTPPRNLPPHVERQDFEIIEPSTSVWVRHNGDVSLQRMPLIDNSTPEDGRSKSSFSPAENSCSTTTSPSGSASRHNDTRSTASNQGRYRRRGWKGFEWPEQASTMFWNALKAPLRHFSAPSSTLSTLITTDS